MKAVVFRPGRGLVYEEVPDYQITPEEVLVKVANAGFCGSDHSLVEAQMVPEGYILGHEVSGVVVEGGAAVEASLLGAKVCIRPTFCGQCAACLTDRPHLCRVKRRTIGIGDLPGGFAEYVRVYPQMLIPIPAGVNSRSAALAETFAAALHAINCTGDDRGSVLVMGGGPIGLSAVRLLKILGYGPIVLFEPVKTKRDIALQYGADLVFDPGEADLDRQVLALVPGGFHKVFECSGVAGNVERALFFVADGGEICIVSVIFKPLVINAPCLMNFKEIRLAASISNTHGENLRCLNWMAQGVLDPEPLISDYAPLEHLPLLYRERICPGLAVKVMLKIGEEF